MNETSPSAGETGNERRNVRLYAGVLAVEALVLSAIWLFQRYFGSSRLSLALGSCRLSPSP